MQEYFFVDESGDPTFFNRKKQVIVNEGASPILILGFIRTTNPSKLRKEITKLHKLVAEDEYLSSIPSITKTNVHFHAKDDCPEVREKVYKLLKTLDFKAEFVVARKKVDIFTKRHKRNEDIFYNEIVSRLFESKLHKNDSVIHFSKRGTKIKQYHFSNAIQTAILNFERKYNRQIETETKVFVQVPSDEPCLQIIDYMNWTIYRAYTKGEMRYFNFVKDKVSLVCDIYDFDKYPKSYYNRRSNPFDIKKTSPLGLES